MDWKLLKPNAQPHAAQRAQCYCFRGRALLNYHTYAKKRPQVITGGSTKLSQFICPTIIEKPCGYLGRPIMHGKVCTLCASALIWSLLGMPTAANAADMAVKAPPPPSPPPLSWTGLYIGLNAGYSWGAGMAT
jgi:hypothetical protein